MIKKNKAYTSIAGVIPSVSRHQGWDVKLDMHSFFPIWDQVVDEDVAGCSRPLKIVKDTLWLEVENSTWMQQLQFDKMRILDCINATLKKSRIKDIKFVLAQEEKQPLRGPAEITFVAPKPDQLARFEEQVASIEDEAIRQSLVRLWYFSKACRRGTND